MLHIAAFCDWRRTWPSTTPVEHDLTLLTVMILFFEVVDPPDFDLKKIAMSFKPDETKIEDMTLDILSSHTHCQMKKLMARSTSKRIRIYAKGKNFVLHAPRPWAAQGSKRARSPPVAAKPAVTPRGQKNKLRLAAVGDQCVGHGAKLASGSIDCGGEISIASPTLQAPPGANTWP